MFYVFFGLVWMIFCSVMIYSSYAPGVTTSYVIFGEQMTYEEYVQLLWPKLFYGAVFLIGLIIFLVGLRKIIKDFFTRRHGTKAFAILANVVPNGQLINEEEVMDVVFLVLERTGECKVYRKNIGTDASNYIPGSFYIVQYYKNNITILSHVDESMVPSGEVTILNAALYSNLNPYYLT